MTEHTMACTILIIFVGIACYLIGRTQGRIKAYTLLIIFAGIAGYLIGRTQGRIYDVLKALRNDHELNTEHASDDPVPAPLSFPKRPHGDAHSRRHTADDYDPR